MTSGFKRLDDLHTTKFGLNNLAARCLSQMVSRNGEPLCLPARASLGSYPTLDLTAAEVFQISQGAASLPGGWSAISQCNNEGIVLRGLIDPEGDGRVAVLIARDIEGLYVARASGEVVARGCGSVTEALTAVRWMLRQRR